MEDRPFLLKILKMDKILKRWNFLEKLLVGILALGATGISFYAALMRYAFKKAPDWGEEMATYLLIWAVFITASILAEERGHVVASLLVEWLPLRIRRVLAIFNALLAIGFCLLVSFFGYKLVFHALAIDQRSLSALRLPLWITYLSVSTGCTLIIIKYAIRVYKLIFQFQSKEILEVHEMSREDMPS